MAAMPASTALAIGDDSMSVIGFDPWVPFVDFLVATHEVARAARVPAATSPATL